MLYDFLLGVVSGAGLMFAFVWFRVEDETKRRREAEAEAERARRQIGRERSERMLAFFEGELK